MVAGSARPAGDLRDQRGRCPGDTAEDRPRRQGQPPDGVPDEPRRAGPAAGPTCTRRTGWPTGTARSSGSSPDRCGASPRCRRASVRATRRHRSSSTDTVTGLWADLADLVLPGRLRGLSGASGRLRHGVCPACVEALDALRPRSGPPHPRPAGPAVLRRTRPVRRAAAGGAAGVQGTRPARAGPPARRPARRGRRGGGRRGPSGGAGPGSGHAAAARSRYGDHLDRLARHCAARLNRAGWAVRVHRPLRALPRPDSVDPGQRRACGGGRGRLPAALRGGRAGACRGAAPVVVLLDDIVTTGVTLAAATRVLTATGWAPSVAAVLAATGKDASS